MKKVASIISAVVAVSVFVGPVFAAGPININANKANQKAGNTITNGSPSAGASAVGVGSVTTTTSAGAISGSTSGVNSTINANTKSGPATTVSGPATTSSGPASTNSGSIKNKAAVGDVQPYQGTEVRIEAPSIPGQAPAIFAPGLTAGAYTCLGAKSGGLSLGVPGGVGVGGTFGSTVESERCNARADAATLTGLGDVDTAKARLCQVEAIAQAYETAGKPCAKPVQPPAAKQAAKPVESVPQMTTVDSTNFGSRGATQGN